ncbi:plasmid mobilization protein [Actinomadura citrea]|uniref:plasmid mobilization protein n=1 Tax=Actinomadura citrea TaxID=46158 RepID=UPI003CE577BA
MGDGEATTATGSTDAPGVPRPAEAPAVENQGQVLAGRRPVRRRRMPGGRRNKFSVRFTDAETDRLQAVADAAGLTVPNLIAETALASLSGHGGQMPLADRRALAQELAAVRSLLTAIGGNVNQLAAKAHAGIVPAVAAVEATMAAVSRTVARLDAVIAPLNPRAARRAARQRDEQRAAG